jgi:hypothetical protein
MSRLKDRLIKINNTPPSGVGLGPLVFLLPKFLRLWLSNTPWPIHFKLRIVIGIDSLMVCILFGEILNFHSRVMGLYSSNCRRFFVSHAVN